MAGSRGGFGVAREWLGCCFGLLICAVGFGCRAWMSRLVGWAVEMVGLRGGLVRRVGAFVSCGGLFFCLGDRLVRRVGIPAVGIAFAKNKIGPG